MTFDYCGYGDSDSRFSIIGGMLKPDDKDEVSLRACAIREWVNLVDQTEDVINGLNFLSLSR